MKASTIFHSLIRYSREMSFQLDAKRTTNKSCTSTDKIESISATIMKRINIYIVMTFIAAVLIVTRVYHIRTALHISREYFTQIPEPQNPSFSPVMEANASKPSAGGNHANSTKFLDYLHDLCREKLGFRSLANQTLGRVIKWLCKSAGARTEFRTESPTEHCQHTVTYKPIGRLGNLMNLYAIVFSFTIKYGITGFIEKTMWSTLENIFPKISLAHVPMQEHMIWEDIRFHQAEELIGCENKSGGRRHMTKNFRIIDYPQRNGIDIFHPHYSRIKKEFDFSPQLKSQAQLFLNQARGSRKDVVFIGVHIRRTDYKSYIKEKYRLKLPGESYLLRCFRYYRNRFKSPLFIISSDDMGYVKRIFPDPTQEGLIFAGNGALESPARDMAILAACNHSIVTVGTYGFWGAYLAGGTVLVPEAQAHIGRGDRGTPLLEIQLAGADNWITIGE